MRATLANKSRFLKSFFIAKKDEAVREFIDYILDGVLFVSNNYYIKWVNQALMDMLGYDETEITGKKLNFILGGNLSSHWHDFYKLVTETSLKSYDIVLRRKDHSGIPVKMNVTPFADYNGATSGWLITVVDMTETKNLIKELTSSRKRLQETVKRLERSRDELIHSEKLSFAGRIASSVAHEIRNPLNIIGMAIQHLHHELNKKDSRREYTAMIDSHIKRVDKLLTDFVDVTRPPKLKLSYQDVNIILEDVLKLIASKIEERKVKLIKKLSPDLPPIRVDKDHMIQAFTNLLLNSCEAMPKKGGRIWISLKRDENLIAIRIRNTGRPIPKKDLIRIGEPFFTTKDKNTGMGMSIAYSIIGSHKGIISVESDKKIGTVFTVSLTVPK